MPFSRHFPRLQPSYNRLYHRISPVLPANTRLKRFKTLSLPVSGCFSPTWNYNFAYHSNIKITDISEHRRKIIAQFDAKAVISKIENMYDVIFETTGSEYVMSQVIPNCLSKNGKLIMVGLFRKLTSFDFNHIVENELLIKGCSAFSIELSDAVNMLENKWKQFHHIVTLRLPLKKYQQAFDILLSPEKKAMKIVFIPANIRRCLSEGT